MVGQKRHRIGKPHERGGVVEEEALRLHLYPSDLDVNMEFLHRIGDKSWP